MLFPDIAPHEQGMLDVGDGHRIYWEVRGDPAGKPAVALHGGPGSGATAGWARYFDPRLYRVVLFDQRNCGRSTPSAAEPQVDLSANTTRHLIADLERLRAHLNIDRWLVFGGSWGSTLALAYAQAHHRRVSELVLFSVVTTSRREVEWITRDMGRVFPAAWRRFRDVVPEPDRHANLAAAYSRLLHDPDPAVREHAAREWCAWEDTHVATVPGHRPDPCFLDPGFRLQFARLVTHYFAHAAWLDEGSLIDNAATLTGIPGVLVHGELDISSPPDIPWRLAQAWPDAELHLVSAGHGSGDEHVRSILVDAVNRFGGAPPAGPSRR